MIRAMRCASHATGTDALTCRERNPSWLVEAAGIDSPVLASSLAFADRIADVAGETQP
jgi:hypothetical protein